MAARICVSSFWAFLIMFLAAAPRAVRRFTGSPAPFSLRQQGPVGGWVGRIRRHSSVASENGQPHVPVERTTPNPGDFGRLDIRVGRIVKVWAHPTADKLYCEEVRRRHGGDWLMLLSRFVPNFEGCRWM